MQRKGPSISQSLSFLLKIPGFMAKPKLCKFALLQEHKQITNTAKQSDIYSRANGSPRHAQPSQSCLGSLQGSRVTPLKGMAEFYQLTSLKHLCHTIKDLILHKRDDIQQIEQGSLGAWRYIRLKSQKLLGFYHWMVSEAGQRLSINFLLQNNTSALGYEAGYHLWNLFQSPKMGLLFRKHSCQKCALPHGLKHSFYWQANQLPAPQCGLRNHCPRIINGWMAVIYTISCLFLHTYPAFSPSPSSLFTDSTNTESKAPIVSRKTHSDSSIIVID